MGERERVKKENREKGMVKGRERERKRKVVEWKRIKKREGKGGREKKFGIQSR